jgi:predicted aconitase
MFHVAGVTPEAPTAEAAMAGQPPQRVEIIDVEDLAQARASLNHGEGPLGAISVGTPHFSVAELAALADMMKGQSTRVPFYVNTSRDALSRAESTGTIAVIESFGATVVTDTCTYITPILHDVRGVVMTNSAKWAFYAPGNLGVDVVFAGLDDCVDSAVSGQLVVGEGW